MIYRLLPSPLHRFAMPLAHRARAVWRRWRKQPISGCSVLLFDPQGHLLLQRHSYGRDVWALPGGGIAKGESPDVAARREVAEELGIMVRELVLIGTVEEELSGAPHTGYVFYGETAQAPRVDRREVIEARFFALDALPEKLGSTVPKRLALLREARG